MSTLLCGLKSIRELELKWGADGVQKTALGGKKYKKSMKQITRKWGRGNDWIKNYENDIFNCKIVKVNVL